MLLNVNKEEPSLILPPRTPCLCCLIIKPNGDCKRVSAEKTSKCAQQVWSSRGKDRQMLQLRTAIRHWRSTWLNLLKLPLCAHGLCVCARVFLYKHHLCVCEFFVLCVYFVILPSSLPGNFPMESGSRNYDMMCIQVILTGKSKEHV